MNDMSLRTALAALALAGLLAPGAARAFDPSTPAGVLEIRQEMDRRQNS